MQTQLIRYIDKIQSLQVFRKALGNSDRKLINCFELILTEDELEIRGGTPKQQSRLLRDRFRMQKIANSTIQVELAIYGSVFSFYTNDRIGIFE